MNHEFEIHETVELFGDVSAAVSEFLDDEFGDDILDHQIYFNDRGERCVAVALRCGDLVEGGVFLVMPDSGSGANWYEIRGMSEIDGPVADFCPQRILDLLSPTENNEALHWRERCRHRLSREANSTTTVEKVAEPVNRWDPEESMRPLM